MIEFYLQLQSIYSWFSRDKNYHLLESLEGNNSSPGSSLWLYVMYDLTMLAGIWNMYNIIESFFLLNISVYNGKYHKIFCAIKLKF